MIIIGEAQRDGFRSGGRFRGASYDRALQVAPLCVLHGIMGTLVYTREALGHFSLRRLQLGVGVSKGHTGKRDLPRTRLVQGTQEHGPLVVGEPHRKRVGARVVHMDYNTAVMQ